MTSVQKVSARVEELLGSLRSGGFGGAAPAAEELVGLLVGLYGDGLAQILTVLREQGPAGHQMVLTLADDPLVESLLLLHDLHPLDVDARIQRALDRVRPYLGSHAGGVEYLGVTDGVARLRLEGSCHGCPSSTVTVQLAITTAVQDAAPEVSEVAVDGMTAPPEPALLQIGRRPDDAPPPAGTGASWVSLPAIGPPSSRPVSATAAGVPVLVCSVRGTLYAYRDACARCAVSMAGGSLDREILTCPGCGAQYNVRLAGAGLDDSAVLAHDGLAHDRLAADGLAADGLAADGLAADGLAADGLRADRPRADRPHPERLHLDPLPLLADSQGVRVAVPEVVPS